MDLPGLTVSARPYERGKGSAVVSLTGRAAIADAAWFRQMLELPEAQGPGSIIPALSRLSWLDWWAAGDRWRGIRRS